MFMIFFLYIKVLIFISSVHIQILAAEVCL